MFKVPHDNTGKLICVSSDDSDQLGHPSSPIRVLDDYSQNVCSVFLRRAIIDHTERMIRLICVFAECA